MPHLELTRAASSPQNRDLCFLGCNGAFTRLLREARPARTPAGRIFRLPGARCSGAGGLARTARELFQWRTFAICRHAVYKQDFAKTILP